MEAKKNKNSGKTTEVQMLNFEFKAFFISAAACVLLTLFLFATFLATEPVEIKAAIFGKTDSGISFTSNEYADGRDQNVRIGQYIISENSDGSVTKTVTLKNATATQTITPPPMEFKYDWGTISLSGKLPFMRIAPKNSAFYESTLHKESGGEYGTPAEASNLDNTMKKSSTYATVFIKLIFSSAIISAVFGATLFYKMFKSLRRASGKCGPLWAFCSLIGSLLLMNISMCGAAVFDAIIFALWTAGTYIFFKFAAKSCKAFSEALTLRGLPPLDVSAFFMAAAAATLISLNALMGKYGTAIPSIAHVALFVILLALASRFRRYAALLLADSRA